jgi:hypothetical protein
MKLSRKTLESAAKELPISAILGKTVSDGLTTKQKNFARAIAMGATKADAYRASYDVTSKYTMASKPYELMRDERIQREIDAYALAIEAEKHRTPAALRSLVIKGLVEIALKDDTKDAVRLQALKTIGQITEVHAFTEHKETRVITSSDDARARVMQELRGILTAQAQDATVIEADADSLMRELSVKFNGDAEGNETAPDADPPTGHPPDGSSGVPRP